MNPPRSIRLLAASLAALCLAAGARADWRDEIGYTRLQLLAGGELPAAPANGYTQAEAPDGGGNYAPNTADANFGGLTFTYKSGTSSENGHAQSVAANFYGNTTGLLPGPAPVDLYDANGWLQSEFLNYGASSAPKTESRAVQNHSWISDGNDETVADEINRRLDFAINRDGFVSVVGVNNGAGTTLPQLLGQSYHTISVGLTSGAHSAGFTTFDVAGRIKPDLVAPDGLTSFATPMVAGAAGLLYAALAGTPYSLTGADQPRVVKALLLASATKDTVAHWSNTSARPLDLVYGAGELNVYHAYTTLRSGRASAADSAAAPARAWAAETLAALSTKTYFFTVPADSPATPFCAALTWHRVITDGISGPGFGNLAATLADLNLRLHTASGFTPGTLLASSASTVDNVELVHQSALAPGTYALVVENLSATATPYALAWHTLPSVSVAATEAIARESDGQTGLVAITRTGDTTLPLLVPLSIGGTAVAGVHYEALPASVTLAAGQATMNLAITPLADALAQGDRTLTVAVAADFALVRDPAQVAAVTLQDKPYDAWRFSHFTAEELADSTLAGDSADPDADGLPNLLEYALGADPKANDAAAHAPAAGLDSGQLTLAYTKPASVPDLTYTVEWSADLQSWSGGSLVVEILSSVENPGATTTVIARALAPLSGTPRQFLRLRVTR